MSSETNLNTVSAQQHNVNEKNANAISINPNPSSGIFKLSLPEVSEVCVYNSLGEQVYKSTNSVSGVSINISSQPKGIYFVKVTTAEGKSWAEKVIIQ